MIPAADFNPYLYALDAPPNWFEFEKYRRSIRKIELDCIQKDPDLPVPPRLLTLMQVADDYEKSVLREGIPIDLKQKLHASVSEPTLPPNRTFEIDSNPICWHPDISQADLEKLDILASCGDAS